MKMNPFKPLLRVNWNSPKLRLFDFGLAFASATAGFVFDNDLFLWAGVAGVVLALINPMARVQKFLSGFRKPAAKR
jgi:hypothetical protein